MDSKSDNHIPGPKFGSLQAFVQSEGNSEDFGDGMYNRNEVHKIAILDLRLLNIDRNTQNILVQKVPRKIKKNGTIQKVNVLKLIPIDHGLCIPDNLEVCNFDLCWLDWRQAS